MMFNRLRQISLDEINFRLRQKIVAFNDRVSAGKRYRLTDSGRSFFNRRIARTIEALGPLKEMQLDQRFFEPFQDRENARRFMSEHFGDDTKRTLDRAGRIIGGNFPLLGHESVSFGSPVRWHFDPLSGKESPRRFWSKIDFLDYETSGDHKVIWELNRHQYHVTLGKAYIATGDEAYARAWIDQIDHWMDSNHPKTGINWASSLEIAFRSISWIWALLFFSGSESIEEEFRERYLSFLFLNGLHIESNLSRYFSPNTHLTGEALGLFYLGLLFQDTKEGKRWLNTGKEILIDQLDEQILPDGVYFEQTSYYHRYTTDIYLHFYILLQRNSMPLPPSLTDRLEQLLDFLAMSLKPGGKTPLFGDDDGGRLLFLDDSDYDDFRSCLTTGAVLFKRPGYKYLSKGFGEETFWLLGPSAYGRFDSLEAKEPETTSTAFPDGGYYVMRSGWTGDASFLMADCGPHGRGTCGHSHADLLSIQVSLSGKDLLIDPGTFTYTGSRELRDYFRGSLAHNTVSVDKMSQSKPAGPFSWSSAAAPFHQVWIPHKEFDFFSGESQTYRFLEKPVYHRRSILFLKGSSLWIMIDRAFSEKERDFSIRFHFAPNEVELADNRFIASDHEGRYGILSFFSSTPPRLGIIDDWRSPQYSIKKPSKTGICSFDGASSCSVITVISPWSGSYEWTCDHDGPAEVLKGRHEGQENSHEIIINDEGNFIEECERTDTDFHWIWKQRHGKEGFERYVCIRGTELVLKGLLHLTFEEHADWLVIERSGHEVCVELPVGMRYSCDLADESASLTINGERIR